jgi:hypothetical protein
MSASHLWEKLRGSPALRPTTPSVTSSLAPERLDDVMEEEADDAHSASGRPAALESVVHLHELPSVFAYAYFERDAGVADIATPAGVVVANDRPVVPRVVTADEIVWLPVLSTHGEFGNRFELREGGVLNGHVEVFVDTATIKRVAFVHKLFTATARAAGLVDRNTLVEFNSPSSHGEKLRTLVRTTKHQMYLPTAEVAIGSALDVDFGLPLRIHARHVRNPLSTSASAVWRRTKQEMGEIWAVAREAVERHNASELARSGLR